MGWVIAVGARPNRLCANRTLLRRERLVEGGRQAMVIGGCTLRFVVRGARSLKDKRRAARSIKDKLHAAFNVAVAEVEDQDKWQSLVLGVAAVGNDGRHVVEVLEKVVQKARFNPHAELVGHDMALYT